ncbi:MAG: 5'-deoxynucleotidase [Clostridia bacterium]|nr:5'-deoxynucleotidase [Clostridia bacterium]
MNNFFALIMRQKYIRRWGLMRNTRSESLCEHAYETAVLAHALATIGNEIFGKAYDPNLAASAALFHDAPEVYTGDLPTPVKYFNEGIRETYRLIEENAKSRLLDELPTPLRPAYAPLINESLDADHTRLVKAADKLSAYIKCLEEKKSGNDEFDSARETTLASLKALHSPELDYFIEHLLPGFEKNLDQQSGK